MTDIYYYYCIMVFQDGRQIPWIKIHNDDDYRLIERIGTTKYRNVSEVENLINKLSSAKDQEKEYEYHENLELQISKKSTYILENSTNSFSCTIETSKLIEILEGWIEFLKLYENGEIPGILYPGNRGLE